jgi:hypothetical protein
MPTRSQTGSSNRRGRSAGKRTRISPRGDTRFIRRDERGRIQESDDAGRSLRTDRRTKAKTSVKTGYGDRGDRRRSSRR